MTTFHSLTGDFPKKNTVVFSDMVGSAGPFGAVVSAGAGTTIVPVAYTNSNIDGADGVFGVAVCHLQDASNSVTYPRSGIYLSRPALGTVMRNWVPAGQPFTSMEVRTRTDGVYTETQHVVGFSVTHNNDAMTLAHAALSTFHTGFHAYGGTNYWRMSVVIASVILFDIVTDAKTAVWQVLRTTLSFDKDGLLTVSFFVNGKEIYSRTLSAVDSVAFGLCIAIPCVESRDKTVGAVGSGISKQGILVDFIELTQSHDRY